MKKHQSRSHAWLSPSGFYRALACPASPVVSEGIRNIPSEAALQGTKAHEWAEKLMRAENPKEYAVLLRSLKNDDEDMAFYIDGYIDFLDTLKSKFQSDKFDDYEEYIEVEGKFTPNIWGTLDYGIIRRKSNKGRWQAIITDLKYGFTEVPAQNNIQLILYLICLEEKLLMRFEKAWMYIYQPRIPREKPYDMCVITEKEISRWRELVLSVENVCLQMKRKERTLGFAAGDHCQFCLYQPQCDTFKAHVKQDSLMLLDGNDTFPEVDNLKIDQLVSIHKQKKQIEHFLENIDHFLLVQGMQKKYIGDLKIVEGQSRRRWIDDKEKVAEGLEELGVNPYEEKLINITAVEKIIGKDQINHLTTMPPGKLQLASSDDERSPAQLGKDALALLD